MLPKLAVPSVGGTVSIYTKSAEKAKGGRFLNYLVMMVIVNPRLHTLPALMIMDGQRLLLLSKWSGDGYIYNTSGEGLTYFAAVGYAPDGSAHKMNLSLLGAGQWHHQRDVDVSIRDYENFGDSGIDRRWNSNGGLRDGEEFSMEGIFITNP